MRESLQLGGRVIGGGDAVPPRGCAGVVFHLGQQGLQDRSFAAEGGVDGLWGDTGALGDGGDGGTEAVLREQVQRRGGDPPAGVGGPLLAQWGTVPPRSVRRGGGDGVRGDLR